jgi:hypothetical protein
MLGRAIVRYDDLKVVAEITDLTRLPSAVQQTDPDWVVVSLARELKISSVVRSLLAAYPHVGILAVTEDGSQARATSPRYPEKVLDRLSLDDLIAILRRRLPPKRSSNPPIC